jgi:hypothetical protein
VEVGGWGSHREWGVTESRKFCQVCRHSKKVGNPCFIILHSFFTNNFFRCIYDFVIYFDFPRPHSRIPINPIQYPVSLLILYNTGFVKRGLTERAAFEARIPHIGRGFADNNSSQNFLFQANRRQDGRIRCCSGGAN